MTDIVLQRNVGALGDLVRTTDHGTSTAGSTGDGTVITGNTIDREGFSTGSLPLSALMGVIYETTLASGKTLSIGYDVQHSADSVNWTDYQSATYVAVATGPSGGGTVKGQFNVQVSLTSAFRYVRFNYTPKHSATVTDTSYSDGVAFFAGFDRLAAPNT
ncbi:MAG TPA: hypothetical protein VGR45_01945 [Stellaceae bacterium]|nr:hypothetical protein [Stellaceae bacterium]